MDWNAVGAIGQIVGAIAVVVTLVYLARQIRMQTNAMQGATELEVANQMAAWHGRRTEAERLAYSRVHSGRASEAEIDAYVWMQAEYFWLCEGWYRQWRRGLMSTQAWESHAEGAARLLDVPILNAWWEQRAAVFEPEFRAYLDRWRTERPRTWTPLSMFELNPAANDANR